LGQRQNMETKNESRRTQKTLFRLEESNQEVF
jgi:hypothetical protein